MKILLLITLGFAVVICIGCSTTSSEGEIQTAIAQTQNAEPTPPPTQLPTHTPTLSPTPTSTPLPFVAIEEYDLKLFLLNPDDYIGITEPGELLDLTKPYRGKEAREKLFGWPGDPEYGVRLGLLFKGSDSGYIDVFYYQEDGRAESAYLALSQYKPDDGALSDGQVMTTPNLGEMSNGRVRFNPFLLGDHAYVHTIYTFLRCNTVVQYYRSFYQNTVPPDDPTDRVSENALANAIRLDGRITSLICP